MICEHLRKYRSPDNKWGVDSCSALDKLYVPSISELKDYCTGGRSMNCSFAREMKAYQAAGAGKNVKDVTVSLTGAALTALP